ncbi:MAG: hypothetical protein NXH88_01100 [Hyphomonas sp.]|nr:hypothetical protein [Hyphomonas sp.]
MDSITVLEAGQPLTFDFEYIMRYHGGGFPGGVVHGLKAMQAAFALFGPEPVERRKVTIITAFTGPGGRDAIEAVTRALTDERLTVDRSLGGHDVITDPPGPYLWRFTYRGQTVEAKIRPGHVREEFVRLGATSHRSAEQNQRLEMLKREMADRLLPLTASDIYATQLLA